MTSLLLIIIYLAFISLGLPDSLLGAAWPVMVDDLGASVSWAGVISMIIAGGTILSSLASDWLTRRLGAGKVTAISVGMTAAALLGFASSHSFWGLCLWAAPYGLGAGSVDAALNNFVAIHYPARHMSWLHCMWGIGASSGPVIMGWAISGGLKWNGGYLIISILQTVLTLILFLSLPLWKNKRVAELVEESEKSESLDENDKKESGPAGRKPLRLLSVRGVKEVLVCFFCYSALEAATGMWAASYCTIYRGVEAAAAARWASLFYVGITAGRFACGFLTLKINDRNMIRLGQAVAGLGILCILLPLGRGALLAGLILTGCGCAPIYPSIIHETPANFGKKLSQSVIGIQMAFAYVGACLIPPLFGLLAQNLSMELFPLFLAVILILMIFMSEKQHAATAKANIL